MATIMASKSLPNESLQHAKASFPMDLMEQFFENMPAPAGILELLFDDETKQPCDLRIVRLSKEFCSSPLFARSPRLPAGCSTESAIGWTLRDIPGYPEARLALLLDEFHSIVSTRKRRPLETVKREGIATLGFHLSGNYCGFMTESAWLAGKEKLDETEQLLEKKEELLRRKSVEMDTVHGRYTRLFHSNIIGVMVCKISGDIIDCNDRFLQILGYERQDLESTQLNWRSLTPESYRENDLTVHLPTVLRTGVCGPFEKQFYGKNGDCIPIEIAGALSEHYPDHIEDSTFICYILDLRSQKKIECALTAAREDAIQAREAAVAASRAKSNFLSTMSHELRTPLAGLLGAQSLLLDSRLDKDQRELVECSIRSGQGLLSLLGDVLDLSKIETGRITLNLQPFDLRKCIEDSVLLIGDLANRKRLEVITYFDESILQEFEALNGIKPGTRTKQERSRMPLTVVSDAHRLRQILINLLSNSIKFTAQGGISIKISMLKKGTAINGSCACASLADPPASLSTPALRAEAKVAFLDHPNSYINIQDQIDGNDDDDDDDDDDQQQQEQKKQQQQRRILIEVSDSGQGIALEKQCSLFTAFSQLDCNASRKYEGAGLGLSICKQLLQLFGGSIGVNSELGGGSTFFFDFPVTLVPSSPAELQLSDHEPVIDPLAKVRCLLVTYTAADSHICATNIVLKKNGLSVLRMKGSDPALLDVIRSGQFDVLVLCPHPTDLAMLHRLQAVAAEPNSCFQRIPTLIVGSQETLNSKHILSQVKNLNTALKPIHEASILNALEQTLRALVPASPSGPINDHLSLPSPLVDGPLTLRQTSINQMQLGERAEAEALLYNALPAPEHPLQTVSRRWNPFSAANASPQPLDLVAENRSPSGSCSSVFVPPAAAPEPRFYMMIAEDTSLIAKILRKQIERKIEHVEFEMAENGLEAVAIADRFMKEHGFTIPLIWMDIMMPLRDGLQATKEIRALEKERGFVAAKTQSWIVALTADASQEMMEMCSFMGLSEYVVKPMSVPTMLQVYERACIARGLR